MSPTSSGWNRKRLRVALHTGTLLLASLVVVGPFSSWVATAIDEPEAVVTGSVYVDADQDDVRDPDEKGLPGVVVFDGRLTTTTDAEGRYSLTVDTDRRVNDLVFASQPTGYVFPADRFSKPRFYPLLGQLADGDTRNAARESTRWVQSFVVRPRGVEGLHPIRLGQRHDHLVEHLMEGAPLLGVAGDEEDESDLGTSVGMCAWAAALVCAIDPISPSPPAETR